MLNERARLKKRPAQKKRKESIALRRELFGRFLGKRSPGRQCWRAQEFPPPETFLAKYL